jgi:hypothetical protein
MDVHVPQAITDQLSRRQVDVLTDWQREGRAFSGLVFGHQLRGTIGRYVRDLELIAKASEPEEWLGHVAHVPL